MEVVLLKHDAQCAGQPQEGLGPRPAVPQGSSTERPTDLGESGAACRGFARGIRGEEKKIRKGKEKKKREKI